MSWFHAALLVSILFGVAGQLLLRAGAQGHSLAAQFLSLHSVLGLFCYAMAAALYMIALRRIPVSVAFPSVSLSYIVIALAAWWLYGELLSPAKLAGIVLIVAGVGLLARPA